MFNNIVIPADGSIYSIRAAEKAVTIAKGNPDAKVTIIYVGDGVIGEVLGDWDSIEIEDQRKEKLREIEYMVKSALIKCEVKIVGGEPGPAIIEYVNEREVDLVVIGSRGLNKLQEMVLGSVSHKVAKRVSCPVMIVK